MKGYKVVKDKPIIVNGIDVSGCEYCLKMTKYRCTIQRDVYKCLCEENPNCYYKQLVREKQKCEKLKQTLTEIKPILELYANSKIYGEEQLDGTYKITVKNLSVLGGSYIAYYDPRPAKQALQKINEVME